MEIVRHSSTHGPCCPYCGAVAELATGSDAYPRSRHLSGLNFWRCTPCEAIVGCHKLGSFHFESGTKVEHDGTEPLGRLANPVLRRARSAAHAAFDPLWKVHGMDRSSAYAWLADRLGISLDKAHIGSFDEVLCARVIAECKHAQRPICVCSRRSA